MKHTFDVKIRGFQIDVFGHVNNARYLEFLEMARWEALDNTIKSGFFAQRNLGFVIVNINISYKNASFINDILTIETSLKQFGNKSITVFQNIENKAENKAIAQADVTFVLMDLSTRKAVELTEEIKQVFIDL